MDNSISVSAAIGECTEFVSEDGKKGTVSTVIAPVKLVDEGEGRINIINGCNMWRSCCNKKCWYSIAARQEKKVG
ncbi:MAG: hypothetical protein PHF31_17400 [Methylobacter sp.]|jgi:hypothetical protein|nr:hypothetical protein [Methylobacter sp.]